MKTLIENCRLISPGIDFCNKSILIENDTIVAVGEKGQFSADVVIDATELMAMPGFIDVHCHGLLGYDFCDGDVEGINKMGLGKLSEGVTSVLPTTLTLDEKQLTTALEAIAKYDQKGCKFPGVHLEGPYINSKYIGAQNPDYVRIPDIEEVKRLNAIYPVRKVSYAPEVENADVFTCELLSMGITPSVVHSGSTYKEFQKLYAMGLCNLSHFCNQMTPLHHRDIGLVGAGLLEEELSIELICDTLHVSPDMIKLTFKDKRSDKIQLISDALRASNMPEGDYDLGGLPITVANGVARLKSNNAIAGSILKINKALKNVYEITSLPLSKIVGSTSNNQAIALGLEKVGKLSVGYLGDIVLLDKDFNVKYTLVNGEVRYTD